jgi:hypothetical protein
MSNHLKWSIDVKPPRPGRSTVRIQFEVTPAVRDKLVDQALREGISFSDVMRDAVDFYLDGVDHAD